MKVSFEQVGDDHNLLGHIIVDGLLRTFSKMSGGDGTKQFFDFANAAKDRNPRDPSYEVVMTVDGVEIDLLAFCEMWQKQISEQEEKLVGEAALELISKPFEGLREKLNELQKLVDDEIYKRPHED